MELIWGIKLEEVLMLIKQVGLALVGATALWGFVLSISDLGHPNSREWIIDDYLSMKLFNLFVFGLIISSVSYYFLIPELGALAHDGISVSPSVTETLVTLPLISILFGVLLVLTFIMLVICKKSEARFSDLLTPFYATVFPIAFIMTSLSGWRGSLDTIQIFYFAHGFHSIFTLGSVIVLDYLFVLSSHSNLLKQHVYRLFPVISEVIWIGLGINFVSSLLIIEHFVSTEKFLFVQTVTAILVINGVLLAGPVSRRMIGSIQKSTDKLLTIRWREVGNVAGALSITSWLTISSLDFFRDLTLGYKELLLGYFGFFILALVGHMIFEEIEKKYENI